MIRPLSIRQVAPALSSEHAAALVVALAPLVYFFPAVRGQIVLCPDDGVLFNLPLRVAAAGVVLGGHWPLWNPYLFGGMPLLGAAQAGLLLPLNWFFLLFSPPVAMNLTVLATYALSGLGAFFYARRSGASTAGAITTGLVWQWSGFLVAQVGHTNVIQTASLLPWLLWSIDGYGMTGRRSRGIVVAVLVALQTFAGHQQTLVYSLLLAGFYAAYMASETRPVRRSYLQSLALLAAGVALAAVQILPTLELMRNSVRATSSYDFFSSFSLPPIFLLTFVAPYLLGGGDGSLFRAHYVGPPFYGEYAGYVGVATVALAVMAVKIKPDRRTRFWAVAALACLALAFGRFWPFDLYRLVYYMPLLNLFRVPARHLMEVDFALAVLAGRAVSAMPSVTDRAKRVRAALAVGACVLLLTCLAVTVWRPAEFRLGREAPVTLLRAPELFLPIVIAALSAWALWRLARGRRAATLVLLAVIIFDLNLWGQTSGWRLSPGRDDPLWQKLPVVEFLRRREAERAEQFRILTVAAPLAPDMSFAASRSRTDEFILSVQPNTYMMHEIQNAAGYDGFGLARYGRLAGDMKVWGELGDPERSLTQGREFDLLNVRYLVLAEPQSDTPGLLLATENYSGHAFAEQNLDATLLEGGARLQFSAPRVATSRVALLTNLSWSVDVPDGRTVGDVRLRAEDGRTFDFKLLAGAHTSEWAYDRPSVKRLIRHRRAPVATSFEVTESEGNYQGHTFVASFALPEKAFITGGEIEVARLPEAPRLSLSIQRLSLTDEITGTTVPVRHEWVSTQLVSASEGQWAGGEQWRRAAQFGNVSVSENTRALPRAWLATRVAVQPDEASLKVIHTGTFPDGRTWEPRRTALVEAAPSLLSFTDGEVEARAEITKYEPNRIDVKTACAAAAVLVLSENHYPGWRAFVDGRAVETLRVDYNLRGVALPPGEHEVRFVYRPKSVLIGLLISSLAALALFVWWRRWPGRHD